MMKLVNMQLSISELYFLCVMFKYFPQHRSHTVPQTCSSSSVRDQAWHPHKTTGSVIISYIVMCTFLEWRQEVKTFCWICFIITNKKRNVYLLSTLKLHRCSRYIMSDDVSGATNVTIILKVIVEIKWSEVVAEGCNLTMTPIHSVPTTCSTNMMKDATGRQTWTSL
jgi:hypothetical protein